MLLRFLKLAVFHRQQTSEIMSLRRAGKCSKNPGDGFVRSREVVLLILAECQIPPQLRNICSLAQQRLQHVFRLLRLLLIQLSQRFLKTPRL